MPIFRGKRFTDASLLGLANIETVRTIALYKTVVTDEGIMAFASKARRLRNFYWQGGQLTDRGIGELLAKCPINGLQIDDAPLVTDSVAPAISARKDMMELYLNGTGITDASTVHFARMPKVWSFCANGTALSDASLLRLGAMPELSLLHLSSTRIVGDGMSALAGLKRIDVYLASCKLSDKGLGSSISTMKNLVRFDVSDNNIGDAAFAGIEACQTLENLRLDKTRVTDKTLERVAKLKNLDTLYVWETPVTAKGVERLKARRPDLGIGSEHCDDE